ncbi:hypothetical protein GCM10010294_04380 [Streptomyces griseoloalbus]|uniref:hypothetical protein n=1 Tax=Streptomyces griseoloalbus TaxID=67303 RepID=UPI0019BAB1DB|nr:hypothetical protein GCM10010294_04380 [Streptomyces griseoloalbus]
MCAADATRHVPVTGALSGDYKGRDAIPDMYRRLGEETGGTFAVWLRQVLVDGRGHAVSPHHLTADRRGEHLDEDGGIVFRLVGDRTTDLDECVADIDTMNDLCSRTMPKAPPATLGKGEGAGPSDEACEPVPAWRTQAAYELGVPAGGG